jgi:cytochrome c oxidase subunit 3
MATTLTPTGTEQEPQITDGGRGPRDGARGDGDGGGREPERTPPPEGYRLGVWLGLIGISMMFLALTSAYIVNQARFFPIELPPVLWLNTAVMLASSATVELARRSLRRRVEGAFNRWLMVTMALGLVFLLGQLMAWRQLVASGFYLNTNRHSGYTYLLTGLHGLHLVGGLLALAYVRLRARWDWTALRRRVSVDATALYWHFLDGLWVYLFILLFFWR